MENIFGITIAVIMNALIIAFGYNLYKNIKKNENKD